MYFYIKTICENCDTEIYDEVFLEDNSEFFWMKCPECGDEVCGELNLIS